MFNCPFILCFYSYTVNGYVLPAICLIIKKDTIQCNLQSGLLSNLDTNSLPYRIRKTSDLYPSRYAHVHLCLHSLDITWKSEHTVNGEGTYVTCMCHRGLNEAFSLI